MLYISGASDDLVEFYGEISDEATAQYTGPTAIELTLASGDVVTAAIEYDRERDGVWRFTVTSGEEFTELIPEYGEDNPKPAALEADAVGYSEVLVISAPVVKAVVDEEVFMP